MKLLLENWREYIAEAQVKFQGILKVVPDSDVIAQAKDMQAQILEQEPLMAPLPETKLHVTLIHQSVLKPFRKIMKNMEFPQPPNISLNPEIKMAVQGDGSTAVKSYFVEVNEQEELKNYVNEVMTILGADPNPEPNRVFHISLVNKTGSPSDSVAYTWEYTV